jgi:hypothetical protein
MWMIDLPSIFVWMAATILVIRNSMLMKHSSRNLLECILGDKVKAVVTTKKQENMQPQQIKNTSTTRRSCALKMEKSKTSKASSQGPEIEIFCCNRCWSLRLGSNYLEATMIKKRVVRVRRKRNRKYQQSKPKTAQGNEMVQATTTTTITTNKTTSTSSTQMKQRTMQQRSSTNQLSLPLAAITTSASPPQQQQQPTRHTWTFVGPSRW